MYDRELCLSAGSGSRCGSGVGVVWFAVMTRCGRGLLSGVDAVWAWSGTRCRRGVVSLLLGVIDMSNYHMR